MPLLADAYAEAHLDLDPLDRDIDAAKAKLTLAFQQLEEAATIDVTLDTVQARAEMRALQQSLEDQVVDIKVEVDQDSVEQLSTQLQDQDQKLRIEVETTGIAQAEFELASLQAIVEAIDRDSIDIDIADGEIRNAIALLGALQAAMTAIDGQAIEIEVDQGQLLAAIAELEALLAKLEAQEATVEIKADIDGVTSAIAELEALRLKAQDIDNDEIRLRVDVEGLAAALSQLGAIDSGTTGLDNTVRIDVDVADIGGVLASLNTLTAEVEALRALTSTPISIDVDYDGLDEGLASIASVEAALAAVAEDDLKLDIDVNIDGVTFALGELGTLRAAMSAIDDEIITVKVRPGETAGTIGELYEIREQLDYIDGFSDLDLRIDLDGGPETLAELEALDTLITELERKSINISLALNGAVDAVAQLQAVDNLADLIDGKNVTIDTDLEGEEEVIGGLGRVVFSTEAIPKDIRFRVSADGVAEVIGDATAASTAWEVLDDQTARPEIEARGLAGFLKDVTAAIAALKAIPNRVSTTISARVSGLSRLTTLGRTLGGVNGRGGLFSTVTRTATEAVRAAGTAATQIGSSVASSISNTLNSAASSISNFTAKIGDSAFGQITSGVQNLGKSLSDLGDSIPIVDTITGAIGNMFSTIGQAAGPLLKFNVFAALATSILTLIAYLAPLATGLIASAAGLLAFGAAAGAAGAGVVALAVLLEKDIIEDFKKGFEGLKQSVEGSLQPVIGYIQNDFIPQLFGVLGQAVQTLAPFVKDALVPIADSVLNLVQTIGQIAGPVLRPLSEGIAGFINQFDKFLAASQTLASEGIESLFNALAGLLELLGQVGIAFAPILNQLLDGLASLSVKSIQPFLQITESFGRAIEPLGGSLSRILSPLGDLAVTFGEIVAQAAPVLDVFYDLATIVFPPLNFDLMRQVAEDIFPSILDFARRARPALDRIKTSFEGIFSRLFSPENVANIQGLFEGILVAIDEILSALDSEGTGDFFGFLIEGASQFIAILLDVGAAVVDFVGLQIAGLDAILEAIAFVANGWGLLLNTIDFLPFIEDRAGDDITEWARNTQDALDGTRDTVFGLSNAMNSGADNIRGFTGELGGATAGLNELDPYLVTNWQMLDNIGLVLPPVVGQFRAVAPSAAEAARGIEAMNEAYSGTISAIEGLVEEGRSRTGVAEFIDSEKVSIVTALDDYRASVNLKIENLKRLNFLEALGFDDIREQLKDTDPEIFNVLFDQIFENGLEGALKVEQSFEGISARLELAAGSLTTELEGILIEGGDEAAINMRNFFQAIEDAVREGKTSLTLIGGEEIDLSGLSPTDVGILDGTVPENIQTAIDETAANTGQAFTDAMTEAFGGGGEAGGAATGVTTAMEEALNASILALEPTLRQFGSEVAVQIGDGFGEGSESAGAAIYLSMANILNSLGVVALVGVQGIGSLIGLQLGISVATGLSTGGLLIQVAFTTIFSGIADIAGTLAEPIGLATGILLGTNMGTGILQTATLLGAAIAAALQVAVGTAAITVLTIGNLLGTGLIQGVNQGIIASVAALGAVLGAAISSAILGILATVVPLGSLVGRAFMAAVAQGILIAGAFIAAALAQALQPGAALGSALSSGLAIGNALIAGIVAGINALAGLIAGVTVAVITAAGNIGRAIGIAVFTAGGIAAALAFANAVRSTIGALAAATAAFAQAVGLRVGLQFTAGVQAGINSGMAGVTVPLGGLAGVGSQLRGIGLSAGQQYGSGLASGIRAGLSSAVAAARAAAAAIAAATRAALEISSPSKVMIRIGEQIAEGVAVGIQNGTPAIAEATAGMGSVIEEYEFLKAFGTPQFSPSGVRKVDTVESADFLRRWTSLTDPNRGKPGAVQAEDGSWITNPEQYWGGKPQVINNNVTVNNPSGDPNRAGNKVARALARGMGRL